MKNFSSSWDLNQALPIQSQQCLPPNYNLSEIDGKIKNFKKIPEQKFLKSNLKPLLIMNMQNKKFNRKKTFENESNSQPVSSIPIKMRTKSNDKGGRGMTTP
jgi:hypothetical protein